MSKEGIVNRGTFYTIISGSFRAKVSQDDPRAIRRDWTSPDGKEKGTKYEKKVDHFFGMIENVEFRDGKFGMQVLVSLDKNEETGEEPVLAMSNASREAEDFLKKLPNVDFSKEVRLRPFEFTGDGGDEVRGMEVLQQDDEGNYALKITNFFRDKEKKENVNGYPDPEGNTEDYSKDDWKIYFLKARKFLKDYTEENICPKFTEQGKRNMVHDQAIDEIPF